MANMDLELGECILNLATVYPPELFASKLFILDSAKAKAKKATVLLFTHYDEKLVESDA